MAHPLDTTRPGRLTSRPEFLAVQKGLRLRGPLFLLEMIDRKQPGALPRIGYTVTRKQGNAVERNRMRRRLREAIRLAEGVSFLPGHDYVLVARRDVLDAPFTRIGTALAERVAEGHRKLARVEAPGGARAADLPNQPRRVTNPQAPGNK